MCVSNPILGGQAKKYRRNTRLYRSSHELPSLESLEGYLSWLGALQRTSTRKLRPESQRYKDTVGCSMLSAEVQGHFQEQAHTLIVCLVFVDPLIVMAQDPFWPPCSLPLPPDFEIKRYESTVAHSDGSIEGKATIKTTGEPHGRRLKVARKKAAQMKALKYTHRLYKQSDTVQNLAKLSGYIT